MPQFVELDIFLQALERGVAEELFEARDVDALRDPLEIVPRRRLCPAKAVPSSPRALSIS